MTDFFKIFYLSIGLSFLIGCSQILQDVDLSIDEKDRVVQEEFKVVEKTLTLSEAKSRQSDPYVRYVIQKGLGNKARLVSEDEAIKLEFPEFQLPTVYKIGASDTLTFSKLIEKSHQSNSNEQSWPKEIENDPYILGVGDQLTLVQMNEKGSSISDITNSDANASALRALTQNDDSVIQTRGRIGSDGSLLLLEVGRLEASGKTINDLRLEVRNILIRNGLSPKFQLEITGFNSQKAYFTVNGNNTNSAVEKDQTLSVGNIIKITDQPLTLREVLAESGISPKPGIKTNIRLQRDQKNYSIDLAEIYAASAKDITIKDKDHIFVDESISSVFTFEVKVGRNGEVILPNLGKIQVTGKSADIVKKEVQILSQSRDKFWTDFQLEVTGFGSQKAILSIPNNKNDTEVKSTLVPISNKPMRLDEVLTQRGVTINPGMLTKINLLRNRSIKSFLFSSFLLDPTKEIYIENGDRVIVEYLPYKQDKVFILGAGISPIKFNISPSNRETLADALFTENGAISSANAKRSEVYLLRGNDPIVAYHLDALDTSRLIVAEAMELRPNDILFVSEQQISSFNRTLEMIFPLRNLIASSTSD